MVGLPCGTEDLASLSWASLGHQPALRSSYTLGALPAAQVGAEGSLAAV